jgi:methionyl-tRNA formyltransferase
MRVVFMGTPAFAVPTLAALHQGGHEVVGGMTQPDRPAGRGRHLTPPPVKAKAVELGFPVVQPERVKAPEVLERLSEDRPDVIVVVGYGQIIPQAIIDLPPHGCVNVHASLLPKYRGAAPMQWAIANGETYTGVTTMLIEKRLDAGDILMRRETEIGSAETEPDLAGRLAVMGASLLIETLERLEAGTIVPRKQDEAEATYAPILKREDGWIEWGRNAPEIFNRIRGFEPWPGSYTNFRGKRLHIRRAQVAPGVARPPGALFSSGDNLLVACGEGTALLVEEVQLEGKTRTSAEDFVRGHRPQPDEILGERKL